MEWKRNPHGRTQSTSLSRVLAAGGRRAVKTPQRVVLEAVDWVDIYDPSLDTWFSKESMRSAREAHTLTTLPAGRVLAIGGKSSRGHLTSAEIYDPTTDTWSFR
jgi:hypothetical protein